MIQLGIWHDLINPAVLFDVSFRVEIKSGQVGLA